LIYYEREDKAGPKNSYFKLIKTENSDDLKAVLTRSIGVKIIVQKTREIYYIANVKIHIDEVPGLGNFVEIEAGNMLAPLSEKELREQCDSYMKLFGIKPEDLIDVSYSDMMLGVLGDKF
jgi:adenylate cyclase class 2